MRVVKLFFALLFLLISGCATTHNPVTAKSEFIFIGTPTEVDLGKSISKQVASQKQIIGEGRQKDRVEKIGRDVARYSDRKDLEYHFFLIKDKELNAFAVPGGFIYINSGLAEVASDDELACVIGHEIVHVAARHSVKQLQASLGYQLLISAALGGENRETAREISNIVFSLSQLGYSRQDETLADEVGIKYAYLANYDPNGMVSFFKRLKEESQLRGQPLPTEIFSSHPDLDNRIKTVENEIKRLKKFGNESDSDTRVN